ncbi:MAG: hypothetical protein A3D92_22030 [Bacteroidetes bacterium RIFCSPHIGHO2_02_FULL_44_7]|nr:MAG: hypothetical protein A3D92_22030 [Bacteroidetes bacterium RIFCSPHIGHO2_02_FULL_44_7]
MKNCRRFDPDEENRLLQGIQEPQPKAKERKTKSQSRIKRFSKVIGKTQSYVSKIKEGKYRIDLFELKQLSKLYEKDIDYFIE